MLHRTIAAITLAAPLLAGSAGCSKYNTDTQPPEETPPVAPAEPVEPAPEPEVVEPVEPVEPTEPAQVPDEPEAVALSDAEILGILNNLHQAEIDQGDLAKAKAQTKVVREFGERMVNEHGEADRRLDAMTANLGMNAAESELGDRLRADAQSKTDALMAMEAGDAFDRQYIDTQIELHARAVRLVNDALLPAAANEAVRNELVQLDQLFQSHLDRAREIQAELAGAPQT